MLNGFQPNVYAHYILGMVYHLSVVEPTSQALKLGLENADYAVAEKQESIFL